MNAGPVLARIVAVIGLIALAPIAYKLATSEITALDAASRAGWLFLGVVILRRTIRSFFPTPVLVPADADESDGDA